MAGDEGDEGADFRLAGRERTGAVLFVLLSPMSGEVAIQIEAFLVRLNVNRRAVVVFQSSFREQAIILAAGLGWITSDQKSGFVGMRLPGSIRIRYPHLQESAISVDILSLQAFQRLLVVGIGPRRRAEESRFIGK